jgi:hypothetical protein
MLTHHMKVTTLLLPMAIILTTTGSIRVVDMTDDSGTGLDVMLPHPIGKV